MDINSAIVTILRFSIVMVYALQWVRYRKAKKNDSTLAFSLDRRSWIEVIGFVLCNLGFMAMFDVSIHAMWLIPLGFILLFMTYYHVRRLTILGKRGLFVHETCLPLKGISKVSFEANTLHFTINGKVSKVSRPLGNRAVLIEGLSGKKFKKGK